MVTIRLSRVGTKNAPSYRIVVQDKHQDPWSKAIEIIGHFNPFKNELVVEADRVKDWVSKGAEVSDSLFNLLVENKILEGKKRNVTHISGKRSKALADEKAKAAA